MVDDDDPAYPTVPYTVTQSGIAIDVSPGVHLSTDELGRIVLVQDGIYIVFDDNQWAELPIGKDSGAYLSYILRGRDGVNYFGGSGSWGTLEYTDTGGVVQRSLTPRDTPTWVSN